MKFSALILSLAFAAHSWAADAQLVGLLAPDSKLIAGVQLQQAKASPFGQFLLSQMGSSSDLDKLRSMTGFDPLTDLTEIVASATLDGKGLVAGRGNFQPQLVNVLASMAGFPVESYRGVALIGGGAAVKTTGQDPTVAFLNGSLMVMGDRALTKAAVDRFLTTNNAANPLTGLVDDISSNSQAWAVATGLKEITAMRSPTAPQSGTNTPPQLAMVQNIVDKIDHVAGGLNFGETVTVRGQAVTKTTQDAQALAAVMQLLMAMQAPKTPLPFTPQVSATGSAVNFTLSMTEQQLEDLLKPRPKLQAAR